MAFRFRMRAAGSVVVAQHSEQQEGSSPPRAQLMVQRAQGELQHSRGGTAMGWGWAQLGIVCGRRLRQGEAAVNWC